MPEVGRDGCRICYALDGPPGRPVLLLSNSLGTSLELWDGVLPALARRFRVIRYDARGHGRSGAPPGPYQLEALGRDALAVLDAGGAARAAVCGLSLGGLTAMWLGVHAPERVSRLVLANTGARIGSPALWNQRIAEVEGGGMSAIADRLLERWFTPDFRRRRPEVVARYHAMIASCSPAGYVGCCAAIRDADLRDAIGAITAPALIVAGAADEATPPALGEAARERIPGARIATLEAAHLSNVEQPERFAELVVEFLDE
jgi:3-oxoadipate enol-lactonase